MTYQKRLYGFVTQEVLEYMEDRNNQRNVLAAFEKLFGDDAVVKDPSADAELPTPGLEDDFKDLIKKLCPFKEISAQEALAHRYFKDV